MFFMCELKRLRKLKAALLARYRCEHVLATLPTLLEHKIETCDEAAALKEAEENLANAQQIDIENKKARIKTTTLVTAIISLAATIAAALLLSLSTLPAVLLVVGGTIVLTLIVHLIAKAVINKSRAKNSNQILACEEELALAAEAFEAAKVRIEEEIQMQIAFYENLLNNPCTGINAGIQKFTVVHDEDKDYNTVCQIIWCFEHKYARSVKEAKQWIARSKHSKYVRNRLDQLSFDPQDDQVVADDATEGDDFSEEIPATTEAES